MRGSSKRPPQGWDLMVVLGIDAAWTERGSSGVALLKCTQRRRHVLKSGTATSGLPLPGVTRQSIRPRKTDFAKEDGCPGQARA
jgi:hypothetical protein